MNRKVLARFGAAYLVFVSVSFLLFCLLVPQKITIHLREKKADKFLRTAEKLIEYPEVYSCNFQDDQETQAVRELLATLDEMQNSEIWLVNSKGRILMDSQHDYPLAQTIEIPNFASVSSKHSYWITGDFFGMFPRETLSVIVPVTAATHTTDFVIIHFALYQLQNEVDQWLRIFFLVLLNLYLCSLILPAAFHMWFYRPLRQTLQVSNDYASGTLSTLEPVKGNDEFSQLRTNLNYMAGELKQFDENQRKFVSNISHDFRSPLTSIKGYAEAILDGTIPKEDQDKYLEIILTETERLTNLTRNILTTNRLKEGGIFLERSVFDVGTVLKTSAAAMEIQCRKKDLHISLDLSSTPQNVNADKEKIQQVIYNLLDNAIKFSYPHSEIRISTSEKRKYIFVSIKDNGEGIPADQIPKIWDRFYKSDISRGKDKKGTGLGLSIVREIIRAHDQNINVVSTKDVGSEFIFTLDKAE